MNRRTAEEARAYLATLSVFPPEAALVLTETLGGVWKVETEGRTLGFVSAWSPVACRKSELRSHTASEIEAGFYWKAAREIA
jgi:hypothetical protein